jgi:NAD+ synthase (glutamine-hydrolysing)
MKIALAQINTKVGDLNGNLNKIISFINKAKIAGADLVVFPELAITGYPPRDLLDYEVFVQDNLLQLEKIKQYTQDIGVICGYVDINSAPYGRKYYNAAALIHKGEIVSKYFKNLLPFYDVFDETRYFEPGKELKPIEFLGKKLGITICEDIWNDKDYWSRLPYGLNPIEKLTSQEIDIIINLSASPYWLNKEKERFKILKSIAVKHNIPIIYVNQVGGNDDLLFDGLSFAVDKNGVIKAKGPDFEEDLIIYDSDTGSGDMKTTSNSEEESLLNALSTGLRDYCHKSGFKKIILGLSGGIDSSVTAVIASQALGSKNVLGITMPSMYSSKGSVKDSEKIAHNLGINYLNIPISNLFNSYIDDLQKGQGILMDLAEENLQARIRANILMLYSNRYGYLLINTGNKSELSVGYCTLYGDMAGGLSVLSDIPKDMVYRLANYINTNNEIIPYNVITKPPSAELRPNQKDQDSLPPYDILDDILKDFIEKNKSPEEIAQKYPISIVKEIIKKINNNEYKRRQAPLGLKVTSRAFGSGRRIPIVQGYTFGIE